MEDLQSKKKQLNICPLEIYDGALSHPRIGVKWSYSDTLLENILASVISDIGGLKSLDYAKKKYLNDWKRPADIDPKAFDIQTIHFLDFCILELQKCLIANSHALTYSSIQEICDMTLAKGLGTLRVALDLSSKGLLHEVLTLCRSSLEMIMWAFAVFDLPEEKNPFEFLPEKAISGFKKFFPCAGQYYGYLSGFSHWRKDTHTRVFDFSQENFAVLYASGQNKWEATANVILMARVYSEGYTAKYTSLKCKSDRKHCLSEIHELSKKISKRQEEWRRFLKELEGQHLTKSFSDIFGVR